MVSVERKRRKRSEFFAKAEGRIGLALVLWIALSGGEKKVVEEKKTEALSGAPDGNERGLGF